VGALQALNSKSAVSNMKIFFMVIPSL